MATREQLTTEERLILAFAEADFRKRDMGRSLAMVQNPDIKLIDLRTVIDSYRERWRLRRQPRALQLVRRA